MKAAHPIALVTGASSGLGRAIAIDLAKNDFTVAITGRSQQRLAETAAMIEQFGGRVVSLQADVTDRKAVETLVDEIERELGAIDLLVNSAGVFRAIGEFSKLDPDDWWREVEINLRGPLLCSRAVLPGMIARQKGRIINLASMAGTLALEMASAYCVSKAGLIRLSEILALETREHGISVFAVNPGTVRTPMSDYTANSPVVSQDAPLVQQFFRDLFGAGQDTPVDQSVRLVREIALGRADALSGSFLDVDDDLDELLQRAGELQEAEMLRLRLRR